MKLLRTVVIKEVVTERKKNEMIAEFTSEINQYERELEQLTFQLYKATKDVQNKHQQQLLRNRYTEEINKRKEKLDAVKFKVQQLDHLELGTEIHSGTAESIVEVNVGDPWPTGVKEIVIKDGIINEIRESRQREDG